MKNRPQCARIEKEHMFFAELGDCPVFREIYRCTGSGAMLIQTDMGIQEKLRILSDAAK